MRVSVPLLYVRLSSSNIYKTVKNTNVNIKKVKHSSHNLPVRLVSLLLLGATIQDILIAKNKKDGDTLTAAPRIRHQFQNVSIDINPKGRVFRSTSSSKTGSTPH